MCIKAGTVNMVLNHIGDKKKSEWGRSGPCESSQTALLTLVLIVMLQCQKGGNELVRGVWNDGLRGRERLQFARSRLAPEVEGRDTGYSTPMKNR